MMNVIHQSQMKHIRNRLSEIYEDNIISLYNLRYCIKNNIILNPRFLVFSSDNEDFDRGNLNQCIKLFKEVLNHSQYKKVIVYCRNIKICKLYSNFMYDNLNDIKICVDTSEENNDNRFIEYEEFKELE